MNKKDEIVLVGAGNVAYNLINSLRNAGFSSLRIISRTNEHAAELARKMDIVQLENLNSINDSTSLIIICSTDNTIESIASEIQPSIPLVHTSGSMPADILNSSLRQHYGVFYPLQSFSKTELTSFENIPVCIEGSSPEILEKLKFVGSAISKKVVEINSEDRVYLHLAAVFANNFTNHMLSIATELMESRKISPDLLHPLILKTAEKAIGQSPSSAQTGPAIRNDTVTIRRHLDLLQDEKQRELYRMITESIQQHKQVKSHE